MSHLIEQIAKLSDQVGEIKTRMLQASLDKNADSSAHNSVFMAEMEAISAALGPICKSITPDGDGYTLHMSAAQAKFLTSHLISTMSLIAVGLETRLDEHASNVRVNNAIDGVISTYSGEDFPVTVQEMLSKGKPDELKAVIKDSLANKLTSSDLDTFLDRVASIVVERAQLDFRAAPVISLFHDIVVQGIGEHKKRSAAPAQSQPLDKEMTSGNVVLLFPCRQSVVPLACTTSQESAVK